ncbi:MAG: hypothetical protein HY688_00830 [Chloroflexi bacterium]|nr:hypothetical protein [Chloroflexota bacterium]
MPYACITRATPQPRWRYGAEEMMRQIISLHMTQAGSLFQGMSGVTAEGVVVLLGLWQDRESALGAVAHPQARHLRTQLASLCAESPREGRYQLAGGVRIRGLLSNQVA